MPCVVDVWAWTVVTLMGRHVRAPHTPARPVKGLPMVMARYGDPLVELSSWSTCASIPVTSPSAQVEAVEARYVSVVECAARRYIFARREVKDRPNVYYTSVYVAGSDEKWLLVRKSYGYRRARRTARADTGPPRVPPRARRTEPTRDRQRTKSLWHHDQASTIIEDRTKARDGEPACC